MPNGFAPLLDREFDGPHVCEVCGLETPEDDLDDDGACSICRGFIHEADRRYFEHLTR